MTYPTELPSDVEPAPTGAYLSTFSGKRIHLDDPQTDQIDLADIARGLAHEGRFSGQTSRFYSVAQHSLLVTAAVKNAGGDEQIQRQALLHDAPEAYLKDIPSPLKARMPGYHEIEEMLWWRVCDRFDIPPKVHDLVAWADAAALTIERQHLMPNTEAWPFDVKWPFDRFGDPGVMFLHWPPEPARAVFADRARLLGL